MLRDPDWEDTINDLIIDVTNKAETKHILSIAYIWMMQTDMQEHGNFLWEHEKKPVPLPYLKEAEMDEREYKQALKISYALQLLSELRKIDF